MKKVLTIDGGGIRGLIAALILQDIERNLPNPDKIDLNQRNILSQHFDLIAGTSTGSILAAGIASGLPLATIISLYEERGIHIFLPSLRRWASLIKRVPSQGLDLPRHSDVGLERELKNVFSDKRLGDIKIPLLIQVYDATRNEPIVFKSFNPDDESDKDLPLWEVVKASSSAPTFFPAHRLKYRRYTSHHGMIDGGVFANNPTLCALAETMSLWNDPNEPVVCVAVGTGEQEKEDKNADIFINRGLAQWIKPLITNVFMEGGSRHVHSLSHRMLSRYGDNNYIRFQVIHKNPIPIDRANKSDICRMRCLACKYIIGDLQISHASHPRASQFDFKHNLNKLLRHFER